MNKEIGTYWYGEALSLIERACLISMMKQNHPVTLYCHEEIQGIPEGVEIRDAREITGNCSIFMYKRDKGIVSPTLFADYFRYRMIEQTGKIWLDLDAYLFKPLNLNNGYLFAWEEDAKKYTKMGFVANGVLGLPNSSQTLKDLISFTENEYPIPPFYNLRQRANLYCLKAFGKPIHISMQCWGTWGPHALTYFLYKNKEIDFALHQRLLYPIPWQDSDQFFMPANKVKDENEEYLKEAISIHIFGTLVRRKVQKIGGWDNVPKDSYLYELIKFGK